jgi:spore germination protein GerM
MMRLLKALALGGLLILTACQSTPTPSPSPSPATTATSAQVTTSATTPTPSAPATTTVTLYFSNSVLDPGASNCAQVYAVHRNVPASSDVLAATLKELLAGPTAAEAAKGYGSWFSPATAQALISAKVSGNTSYVNLTDLRTVIPNASTSCGSASLLAQLRTTAQQGGMTPRVLYAINGQPKTFWEWLQVGCDSSNDNCNPAPFTS